MAEGNAFAAQLLESSSRGYAGLAAGLLFERSPDLGNRYEAGGPTGWREQLERWLLDLAASVEAGEPGMFLARMAWTRRAFESRGGSAGDLIAAVEALRDTLKERLPDDATVHVDATLEQALAALGTAASDADERHPTAGRRALAYLAEILEGRPQQAIDRVLDSLDDGVSARQAYLEVLLPAQREVGRMWHLGELNIVEEHVISATTQRAMALLCERARPKTPNGKTALLSCVRGNLHDIGLRAIADFFEMGGWRSIHLGADVPEGEIARSVVLFDADVVVLAVTLDPHLRSGRRTIERIRALADRDPKVIVGGPVFDELPQLWRKIGADGYAPSVEDAEPLAAKLVGAAS